MSSRRSDPPADAPSGPSLEPELEAEEGAGADPLRPSDHADSAAPVASADSDDSVVNPRLGPIGWVRFAWRQLTSMRTALILLLLLALAAVPGSLVPQNSADPNGVIQYKAAHPDEFKILDALQVFDTYTSFWFSAIYLLLFVSLIGCIIPRTLHHARALRAKPPATPARLSRLVGHVSGDVSRAPEQVIDEAAKMLKKAGYRVERFDTVSGSGSRFSVSAERGYLRETGNLVFHTALVGVLVTVAIGGGFVYTGQKVIVQDSTFTNVRAGYDSIDTGRFFDDSQLQPFSIRLDDFDAQYSYDLKGNTHPEDFTASVSTRAPGGDWKPATIKVNSPLAIGGTQVYLLGNGYAPEVVFRNAAGEIVDDQTVPFLPQDANLTSLGVIKVPDGLDEQLGLRGFFYPQPRQLTTGAFSSILPEADENSLLSLSVYSGDLGLDAGTAVNVYQLDTEGMTEIAGRNVDVPPLQLKVGETVDLPNGLGSIEFAGWKRFISVDIHHDPTQVWVLLFAILIVTGLLTSLFIPRRRIWVAATASGDGSGRGSGSGSGSESVVELAGLARGDDPRLEATVSEYGNLLIHRLGSTPQASTPVEPTPPAENRMSP